MKADFKFNADKSVLNVLLDNGDVYIYKRAIAPDKQETCTLIRKSGGGGGGSIVVTPTPTIIDPYNPTPTPTTKPSTGGANFPFAPLGAKIGIIFLSAGVTRCCPSSKLSVQHAPPPAYFSYVPTGLCGTSEPRRGDRMDRQVVKHRVTPADKNKILEKRKDGRYFNPSIKNFRRWRWIMPFFSCIDEIFCEIGEKFFYRRNFYGNN